MMTEKYSKHRLREYEIVKHKMTELGFDNEKFVDAVAAYMWELPVLGCGIDIKGSEDADIEIWSDMRCHTKCSMVDGKFEAIRNREL